MKQLRPYAFAALILAACGSAAAPTVAPLAAVPATGTATAPAATVASPAANSPIGAPLPAATATAAPAPTADRLAATAVPRPGSKTYKGIEQGLTADGLPYLGRADAPITLTDYSDFL